MLPSTPQTTEEKGGPYNSLRSILREKNTPGTGQSVRFFSRDAYKVITPNSSAQSSELDDPSFFTRLQLASKTSSSGRSETARPSAREIFANATNDPTTPVDPSKTHDINSLMMPVPPPNFSNMFDLSQEQQPSAILPGEHPTLQDNAIEIQDESSSIVIPAPGAELLLQASPFPSELSSSISKLPGDETNFFSPADELNCPLSPLNKPFDFGRPVFRPLPSLPADPPLPPTPTESSGAPSINSDKRSSKSSESPSLRKPSRTRAISDTVFQAMIRTASLSSSKDSVPESDINDKSAADLSFDKPVPDPFSIDATTYYTPGTMMPPTPPESTHARTASREDDLLWFLRTQLAIQQELNVQYEVDISARNELVSSLTSKLQLADKDKTQRNNVLRTWKKKVQELEKACQQLEDECERSRQESFERSIIDHASGEALRELHRVIARLEREKVDGEKLAKEQVRKLADELKRREDSENRLREGINEAKEQMEIMGGRDEEEEERQRQRTVSLLWNQEREELIRKVEELENKNLTLASEPSESERLAQRYADLQAELEAQWRNTETMVQENAELKKSQDALQQKVIDLEGDWNESENRRLQSEAEVEEVWAISYRSSFWLAYPMEQLREQLKAEQESVDELTLTLEEQKDAISALEEEHQLSLETISRLGARVSERDADATALSLRAGQLERENEVLRDAIGRLEKERGREADEQSRELCELAARESESRQHLESVVSEKAQSEILVNTLQNRVGSLDEEVGRLRRQVHELQQESAAKEVTVVQLNKWREQDKEDIKGLNMALDSKQQELELVRPCSFHLRCIGEDTDKLHSQLKRKIGVRGTAGSTPAPASHKRDPSVFNTPSVIRPPSALSDNSKDGAGKEKKSVETSEPVKTLAKSVRANGLPSSVVTKAVSRIESSMGAPPSAARKTSSLTRTPSRQSSIHSRSASTSLTSSTPTPKPAAHQRRVSNLDSVTPARPKTSPTLTASRSGGSSPTLSEKENSRFPKTPMQKVSITKRTATPA